MTALERVEKNFVNYKRDVLEIEKFLTGTLVAYDYFKGQYPFILNEFGEKERSEVEKEGMKMFENLNLNIPNYEVDIHAVSFINLIARTEAFLNDTLETLFLWKKHSLISDKSISYKEIINSESIDDLVKVIRENAILEFSHAGFGDKLKLLKKRFNITFSSIEEHKEDIVELFTTRNIILHNNGIVNKVYLDINKSSVFKLGERRVISKNYLKLTFVLLVNIGKSVNEQIAKKVLESSN